MERPTRLPVEIFTVSGLTSRIRDAIYRQFRDVLVEGEISNFKLYPSGHLYFTLKDDNASIKGVVFNYSNRFPDNLVKDGVAVICVGRVDVYEKRGEYRLLVDDLEVRGVGLLQLKFQVLKEKLFREGLFDTARKKALPFLPCRIGIVTSPAGAAVRDMLKVIFSKFENMDVVIYPVRVQGEEAAAEIAEGIGHFNQEKAVDVIIVGRGGGSFEDLACFNEEVVARAIYASDIPVVSAVGHEIDFTIADFVADVRAPTPTAAADMVVRDKRELVSQLGAYSERLALAMRQQLKRSRLSLYEQVVELKERKDFFVKQRMYVDELSNSLSNSLVLLFREKKTRLEALAQRLQDLNPDNILKRGYSITTRADTGAVITDSQQIVSKDRIRVRFHRGEVEAVVEKFK
jgi:exodeoxyribonuclease VII large subunit